MWVALFLVLDVVFVGVLVWLSQTGGENERITMSIALGVILLTFKWLSQMAICLWEKSEEEWKAYCSAMRFDCDDCQEDE